MRSEIKNPKIRPSERLRAPPPLRPSSPDCKEVCASYPTRARRLARSRLMRPPLSLSKSGWSALGADEMDESRGFVDWLGYGWAGGLAGQLVGR